MSPRRRTRGLAGGKFSILLHAGNVPGLTKRIINGTALDAEAAREQMEKGLPKEDRDAGWWYEVREEPSAPAQPPHKGREGGRGGRRDNSRR
jgi:hypothetical protein